MYDTLEKLYHIKQITLNLKWPKHIEFNYNKAVQFISHCHSIIAYSHSIMKQMQNIHCGFLERGADKMFFSPVS